MRMILLIIIFFNMVAVQSTGSGSSTNAVDKELNIAKLVAAVSKLNKCNYHLWFGGIATVIMTGKAYLSLKAALQIFKTDCNDSVANIKAKIRTNVCGNDADNFSEVNSSLY